MDLELLRTFLELNRTRHFGRAAEALFVTQAAVSNRLKLLESRVGTRLFERGRGQMGLTPAGARLVGHAERMLAAWNTAAQDVSSPQGQQLVIGGSLRLWDALLQPWLHAVRRAWPDISIIAESRTPEVLMRKVLDGQIDVAVALEPAQLESLRIDRVAEVELVCVSTRASLCIAEAFGHDYVYVDWGSSFELDHRREFPDAPESFTRLASAKMALDYLHAIGGTAYLPRLMVASEVESGFLHRVAGAPVFERQAFAVYPVRTSRKELIQRCLALLRTNVLDQSKVPDKPHNGATGKA